MLGTAGIEFMSRTFCGYRVNIDKRGRNVWPEESKAEAVRKIQNGAQPPIIANEIGATDPLVRKWERNSRPLDYAAPFRGPAFTELSITLGADNGEIERQQCQRSLSGPMEASEPLLDCRLQFDGMTFEFNSAMEPRRLSTLVMALRRGTVRWRALCLPIERRHQYQGSALGWHGSCSDL